MTCVICGKGDTEVLHEHHVIPQACGGRDGPVVKLCAEHHNMIHMSAVKLCAGIRNGKSVEFQWPKEHGNSEVARYLVGEIVKATLNAKSKLYKATVEFDQTQRDMLDLLKHELGVTSITKVIYSCLDIVFKSRFK